jgi:hypothetical protein
MAAADAKPLPFVYQFAAGAVAGVSEVSCDWDSIDKLVVPY